MLVYTLGGCGFESCFSHQKHFVHCKPWKTCSLQGFLPIDVISISTLSYYAPFSLPKTNCYVCKSIPKNPLVMSSYRYIQWFYGIMLLKDLWIVFLNSIFGLFGHLNLHCILENVNHFFQRKSHWAKLKDINVYAVREKWTGFKD